MHVGRSFTNLPMTVGFPPDSTQFLPSIILTSIVQVQYSCVYDVKYQWQKVFDTGCYNSWTLTIQMSAKACYRKHRPEDMLLHYMPWRVNNKKHKKKQNKTWKRNGATLTFVITERERSKCLFCKQSRNDCQEVVELRRSFGRWTTTEFITVNALMGIKIGMNSSNEKMTLSYFIQHNSHNSKGSAAYCED